MMRSEKGLPVFAASCQLHQGQGHQRQGQQQGSYHSDPCVKAERRMMVLSSTAASAEVPVVETDRGFRDIGIIFYG